MLLPLEFLLYNVVNLYVLEMTGQNSAVGGGNSSNSKNNAGFALNNSDSDGGSQSMVEAHFKKKINEQQMHILSEFLERLGGRGKSEVQSLALRQMLECARGPLLKWSDNVFLLSIYAGTMKSWLGLAQFTLVRQRVRSGGEPDQTQMEMSGRILVSCLRADSENALG